MWVVKDAIHKNDFLPCRSCGDSTILNDIIIYLIAAPLLYLMDLNKKMT